MPSVVRPETDGAVERDLQRDVDATFAELVLADDELVRLEFEALVAECFGPPPAGKQPPVPVPAVPAPTGDRPGADRETCPPRCPASQTSGASRRRNRQRGPPLPGPVLFS